MSNTLQGGAIEGNPAKSGTDDALMVNQRLPLALTGHERYLRFSLHVNEARPIKAIWRGYFFGRISMSYRIFINFCIYSGG
ncbi:MAG: hypothetical protein JRJ69_02450 [Deltaproteobacteria bacterium]|nr:hypothetical protein [Deltaproteobacteria bacterium]MBW1736428.1 hypothetical protein [Deltaproteobacteria bacterium]MBW1907939.1 hypothetical protein [Deltaproteobacteria bacterium]MBW2033212.1 hypothetical protein [Deltaproteobacteria bacterium]MBW2113723.1 hypothetical protein [Deltaproteobacteria bacterium]